MIKNKAVFIDRDGVVNRDYGYIYKWEDFFFLDQSINAMRLLIDHGFLIIIVTNQSGIGRGYYSEEDYKNLTLKFLEHLEKSAVNISGVYHCPHTPEANCGCRKPAPGMILRAQRDHQIQLHQSFMVGDKGSDIEAGQRAGVGSGILITNKKTYEMAETKADYFAPNLFEAAEWIVSQHQKRLNEVSDQQ